MHVTRTVIWAAVLVIAGMPGRATGAPVVLTVIPGQSNINVTLCMTVCGTLCPTDSSVVTGTVTTELDCVTNPGAMTLHGFNLALTETLVLNLNFGICGVFNSSASGVTLLYGTPGTPMPPTPLGVGGAFTLGGVPAAMTGSLTYNATSLVCLGLQGAGYPCSDTLDLSQFVLAPVNTSGTVTTVGRAITMTLNVNTSAPIDPNNPGLGTITIAGTIVSTGTAALPDLATFVAVLLGENTDLEAVCASDVNDDGLADGRDVGAYVSALLGP